MRPSEEALARKQAEHSKRIVASRIINDSLGSPVEYGQDVAATLVMDEIEMLLQLGNQKIAQLVIVKLILFRRTINSAERLKDATDAFVRSVEVARMEEETNQRRLAIQAQIESARFDTQNLPSGRPPVCKPTIYRPEDDSQ